MSEVYPQLLTDLLKTPDSGFSGTLGNPFVQDFWTTGPLALTGSGRSFAAAATAPDPSVWGPAFQDFASLNPLPMQLGDTSLHTVTGHGTAEGYSSGFTSLQSVGVYDPAEVDLGSALAAGPVDPYSSPSAAGADAASRTALGGRALRPSAAVAGPVAQRPQLLTSLDALPALDRAPYTQLDPADGVNQAAPIDSIRVRVSGAVGMDALSRAKVEAVADRIRTATGLHVDFLAGSSPTAVSVAVPAGRYGRPALRLSQLWTKEGVAAVLVTALDRTSLLLAVLVLAACALAVANAGSAAVRSRATELGVLACLGWPRRALFALMLGEAAGTGLVAGVAGTALALGAAPLLGVGLRAGPVELAAPVALLLSLAAGLLPAWQATRADPGVAVRPAVARVRRAGNPHRVGGLALGNLLRRPGRTLLGTVSQALGVAALTLLAVVDLAFRGTVAGTLLGDAVTVQVQGGDYIAAAITALLGAATVADVLYIAIDERSAEYALLSATGWTDRLLATLVCYEALGLGLVGAVTGAAAAVGIAAVIDAPWHTALLLSASVGAGGTLLALLAAVLPLRALRRLPTARLLAEE